MISALQQGKYSIERKEDVLTSCLFDTLLLRNASKQNLAEKSVPQNTKI
jgi:hypothetical protein